MKPGQVLSTRPDLLSPSWIAELERLHSDVAPISFDELLPQIEKALGRSPFEVFADVEREPSCRSFDCAGAPGQSTERGTCCSKDQTSRHLRQDCSGLGASRPPSPTLIEHEIPGGAPLRASPGSGPISTFPERELDLAVEARHVDRFARNFADDPHILIPKVYWDLPAA